MDLSNPAITSSTSVLADLKFYERLVIKKTQQLMDTFNQPMIGKQNEDKTDELAASVAAALGDLSARLQVVEMVLAQEKVVNVVMPEVIDTPVTATPSITPASSPLPDSVTLLSSDLCLVENFHKTEGSSGKFEYNWTGKSVETDVKILVSRKAEKELRIRVANTLKNDALQTLRIKIDGQEVPHQSIFDGELRCIVASMSAVKDKTDASLITIDYPGTCTPESLDISNDNRHLGVAIHSIGVAD